MILPFASLSSRITSYNVCYTKLLRNDYDLISLSDELVLENVREAISDSVTELTLKNKTTGNEITVLCELSYNFV